MGQKSRRKRERRNQPAVTVAEPEWRTGRLGLMMLVAVLLAAICLVVVLRTSAKNRVLTMQQLRTVEYRVNQVILTGRGDSIPEIASLMQFLKSKHDRGEVSVRVAAQETGDIASAGPGPNGKPEVVFSGPIIWQIMEDMPENFADDVILEQACHEVLHLQMTPEFLYAIMKPSPETHKIGVAGEAKVYAAQAERVIRPMIAAGRAVSTQSHEVSEAYKACGDKDDEKWQRWVETYFSVR